MTANPVRFLRWPRIATVALGLAMCGTALAMPQAVETCAACHGAHAGADPAAGYPRLVGLPASYTVAQLHTFASGARANGIMYVLHGAVK